MTARAILQHALPLISTHGFTRKTLSLAVMQLPTPHSQPLSETAITALFGNGDDARRTLINGWLKGGLEDMQHGKTTGGTMQHILKRRLRWNEPVLEHLPEAFALLVAPQQTLPRFDIRPAISHAASVADEACYLTSDSPEGTSWYVRRAVIASIYTAAELHQITSPQTSEAFLDELLEKSESVRRVVAESSLFAEYVGKSWGSLIKSRGIF
ncbi:hypothetical protein SISSUDRAFT_107614 [Sistotremastrum suecicum HHB10207 ss-3]|uniref:Ubiquinone biosynthesis protein n=1 Tax=Sistotremastrum suecicum HHB10207 ss-3 TaxID=1314776 RepID=A0A166GXX0_9AGAM|nr:hypothetical protein SISSUDRAFT_107614 [Sistotremastrum suecicum HHB10207 ss-3]